MESAYFIIAGGLTLLVLIVVQILIGNHKLKVNFKYHKYLAYAILVLGLLHGMFGIVYLLGL